MKSTVCRFGIVVMLAAMLVPFTSFAQNPDIQVKVPFAFVVGDRALPSGMYNLKPISQASKFWQIIGDGRAVLFSADTPIDGKYSYPPRLTFRCYANECFLSELHASGDWALPASGRQQQLAKKTVARETREVALR